MSGSATRVVLVPGVFALLPEFSGLVDPVAPLRRACLDAVGRLGRDVEVLADPGGARVAAALLAGTADRRGDGPGDGPGDGASSVLVVGNGSGCRSARAPGHLDERALAFDAALDTALRTFDLAALGGLDTALADELWASVDALVRLPTALSTALSTAGSGSAAGSPVRSDVDYDDDPFGVRYWVARWELG